MLNNTGSFHCENIYIYIAKPQKGKKSLIMLPSTNTNEFLHMEPKCSNIHLSSAQRYWIINKTVLIIQNHYLFINVFIFLFFYQYSCLNTCCTRTLCKSERASNFHSAVALTVTGFIMSLSCESAFTELISRAILSLSEPFISSVLFFLLLTDLKVCMQLCGVRYSFLNAKGYSRTKKPFSK